MKAALHRQYRTSLIFAGSMSAAAALCAVYWK